MASSVVKGLSAKWQCSLTVLHDKQTCLSLTNQVKVYKYKFGCNSKQLWFSYWRHCNRYVYILRLILSLSGTGIRNVMSKPWTKRICCAPFKHHPTKLILKSCMNTERQCSSLTRECLYMSSSLTWYNHCLWRLSPGIFHCAVVIGPCNLTHWSVNGEHCLVGTINRIN